MGGMWDGQLAVGVETGGLLWTFGPFHGMPDAMGFVSTHVWDTDRYRHHYAALIDPAEAADRLNHRIGEPDVGTRTVRCASPRSTRAARGCVA